MPTQKLRNIVNLSVLVPALFALIAPSALAEIVVEPHGLCVSREIVVEPHGLCVSREIVVEPHGWGASSIQ